MKNNQDFHSTEAQLAGQKLQEMGLDSQQAALWVKSRVLDGLNPLEELHSILGAKVDNENH